MLRVINHLAPIDECHSLCDPRAFECRTRCGNAKNISTSIGPKPLPVGRWINKTLKQVIFSKNCLNDGVLAGLLHKHTTSLNESWHHVLHSYGPKRVFFTRDTYKQIVYRAVMQWNLPYLHLIKINELFGIQLSNKCLKKLKKLHEIKEKRKEMFRTHEYKLKRLQKKKGYKVKQSVDKTTYKSGGFWSEWDTETKDEDQDERMNKKKTRKSRKKTMKEDNDVEMS